MAETTYYWADLLNIVSKQNARVTLDDYGAMIVNKALNELWDEYDWPESISPLPPFWLLANEQDHCAPAVSVPANFHGLRMAYLTRTDTEPPWRQELRIIRDVRETHVRALPHAVGFEKSKRAFRVFPRVPANIGAPFYLISGTYKHTPTKVEASVLGSTLLPFEDHHVGDLLDVVRWAAYDLAGDQRAGGVSVANGMKSYSGARAVAHDAIDRMAASMSLMEGDVAIAPAEGLVETANPSVSGVLGMWW